MITIFNQKKLLTVSDPIELARVKTLLSKEKIPYAVKTITSRGALGRGIDANIGSQYGQAYSANITYIYHIYVRSKNLTLAKKTIT